MNLLPPDIMRRRKLYNGLKKMAAVQAVIFLLSVLLVQVTDLTIRLREVQTVNLEMEIQSERFVKSEAVIQEIREYHVLGAAQYDAVIWLNVPAFNTNRLDMIEATLPMGVRLINIELERSGATISAETENLSLADIHRDEWAATGLVSRAHLTYANVAIDGTVRYILSLRWVEEGYVDYDY